MPKYLYLNDPGSRWHLADDVDLAELQQQLDDTRFGTVKTEVVVDGVRRPLTIRHDQLSPHALIETSGTRPARAVEPEPV